MSEKQIEEHALRFSKMYQYDKKKQQKFKQVERPASPAKNGIEDSIEGAFGNIRSLNN